MKFSRMRESKWDSEEIYLLFKRDKVSRLKIEQELLKTQWKSGRKISHETVRPYKTHIN